MFGVVWGGVLAVGLLGQRADTCVFVRYCWFSLCDSCTILFSHQQLRRPPASPCLVSSKLLNFQGFASWKVRRVFQYNGFWGFLSCVPESPVSPHTSMWINKLKQIHSPSICLILPAGEKVRFPLEQFRYQKQNALPYHCQLSHQKWYSPWRSASRCNGGPLVWARNWVFAHLTALLHHLI